MPIVTCPNGHELEVGEAHAGQRVQCPACGAIVGGKPRRVRRRRALSPVLVVLGIVAVACAYVARRSIWPEEEPDRSASAVATQPAKPEPPDWLTSDPEWEAGGETPHLPGAVAAPPDDLRAGAPFDVDELFAPIPPEENAAPLYLAAFAEFDPSAARCFPLAERRAIYERTAGRKELIDTLFRSWDNDPDHLHPEKAEQLMGELSDGFRLLAEAQIRPRCVFESGLDAESVLPQLQCAHSVMKATLIRIECSLVQQDAAAVERDLAILLRLSRDICGRGGNICQRTSILIQYEVLELIGRLKTLPWMGVAHCERLLALLAAHDRELADRFSTALGMEYVMYRNELNALAGLRERREATGAAPPAMRFADLKIARTDDGDVGPRYRQIADVLTPAEARAQLPALDECHTRFAELWRRPYRHWMPGMLDAEKEYSARAETALVGVIAETWSVLAMTITHEQTRLHGVQCLLALRIWQLRHDDAPPSLDEAAREAGLDQVPRDEYSGGPMRFKPYADAWMAYSVNQDGLDEDGAFPLPKETDGDFLFFLSLRPPR